MDNDDRTIGEVLPRREALRLLGSAGLAGAALLAGCAPEGEVAPEARAGAGQAAPSPAPATAVPPTDAPAAPATDAPAGATSAPPAVAEASAQAATVCVVRPAQSAGPFFVEEGLNRADIRPDPATGEVKEGVPLQLTFNVQQLDEAACVPFEGVTVDVWHCDALGVYSDVGQAAGQKWLRGHQVTDASGQATFQTIYPGWYPGRTVHIHFLLRTDPDQRSGLEFVSQLYFDDALTDQVMAQPPYSSRGARSTRNADDGLYRGGGEQLMLALTPEGDGYTAVFDVAMDVRG